MMPQNFGYGGYGQPLPLSPQLAGAPSPYGGVQVPGAPSPYGGVQVPPIDPRAIAQQAMQQGPGQQQGGLGPLAALAALGGAGGGRRRRAPQMRGQRRRRRRRGQPTANPSANAGPLALLSMLGGG